MTFANPLSAWALALVIGGALAVAWMAYRRAPIPRIPRLGLIALRFVTLLLIVVFLMRPVARSADEDGRDAVVAILVDTSRSMSIQDADGQRRHRSGARVRFRRTAAAAHPAGSGRGPRVCEGVGPAAVESLGARGRRTDLSGALVGVRDRLRGRAIAGIVLLSDGGDTSGAADRAGGRASADFSRRDRQRYRGARS